MERVQRAGVGSADRCAPAVEASSEASRKVPVEAGALRGRAYLRAGHRVYLGHGTTTALHATHSVKIVVALEGTFRVRLASGPWARVRSIAVGSEVPHALEGNDPVAVFWIQPEAFAAVGRGRRLSLGAVTPLGSALEERVRAPLRRCHALGCDPGELDELAAAIVHGMRAEVVVTRLDPRVTRVIDLLESPEGSREPLGHAAIAAQVNLSATRLTHLFREETGISLRNYHLWNRGRLAVARLAQPLSLTALAHASGFADGAHLSRTSRRMLGVTPSQVQRRCRFFGD